MLQQQSVVRVVPVYRAFLERFPDVGALAAASRSDVVRVWSAIGLNRQAVRLQEIARAAVASRSGRLPASAEALRRFKGVGRYTAAAVLCFAHGRREAMVDTNIRRVLSRLLGPAGSNGLMDEEDAWRVARELLPRRRRDVYDWNQGLMDLGATVCLARVPRCPACPLAPACPSRGSRYEALRRQKPFEGSFRQRRARALRLVAQGPRKVAQLDEEAVAALSADGLVEVGNGLVRLPG